MIYDVTTPISVTVYFDATLRLPYFIEEVYNVKENPNLEYISL